MPCTPAPDEQSNVKILCPSRKLRHCMRLSAGKSLEWVVPQGQYIVTSHSAQVFGLNFAIRSTDISCSLYASSGHYQSQKMSIRALILPPTSLPKTLHLANASLPICIPARRVRGARLTMPSASDRHPLPIRDWYLCPR